MTVSTLHVLYSRITTDNSELPRVEHFRHVCKNIDQYVKNVCTQSAVKLLYPWLKIAKETSLCCAPSASFSSYLQIPLVIRRYNSGVTYTDIFIILESLQKPRYGTLRDSKFVRYFDLHASAYQETGNSTI